MLQVLSVNSQGEDFKALDIDSNAHAEAAEMEAIANYTSLHAMFDVDFHFEESGAPPTIDGFTWVPVDGTKCFKGETAGYYKSTAGDPTKLVIYLQGGGGCMDPRPGGDCEARPADRFVIAPESPFPPLIDSDADTFGAFTRVYVPYCTQDLWAGNKPAFFTGQANLKAFLPQMVDAGAVTEVLLAGTSAGGIGTFLNCKNMETVFTAATVKCAAIDGFFFPFAQAEAQFKQAFAHYGADDSSKGPYSIVDDLVGQIFVGNAIFDPLQMTMMKKATSADVKAASAAIMQQQPAPFDGTPALKGFANVFGKHMVASLSGKVPESAGSGLFLMNCFNHAKSSKPGRVCSTPSGTQTEIKVDGTSVLDAVTSWYNGGVVRVIDTADLNNLNPTCPRPGPCDTRVIR